MTSAMIDELAALLGDDRVSTDPSDLEEHARDWSSRRAHWRPERAEASSSPLAVVRPHDSVEVARRPRVGRRHEYTCGSVRRWFERGSGNPR